MAKGTLKVPILPISMGTNNVFPFMVEATIAGMAAGLVAANLVPLEECTFTSTKLEIKLDGKIVDLAVVDVAGLPRLICGIEGDLGHAEGKPDLP